MKSIVELNSKKTSFVEMSQNSIIKDLKHIIWPLITDPKFKKDDRALQSFINRLDSINQDPKVNTNEDIVAFETDLQDLKD